VEIAGQSLVSVRDFDRVEILALDVLDQGHLEEPIVSKVLDNDRDGFELCQAGRAPTAFAGHKLEALGFAPDKEGLDDAVCPDGVGEFLEALSLKDRSGLEGVRIDQIDWKLCDWRGLRGIGFELRIWG
jgi:hypothetical protein